jgi:hypothetical protein
MAGSREEIKAAGTEAARAQLASLGSERARDRRADALLPIALRAAQLSRVRLSGMSAAVGLSRQGTYDALGRDVDETVTDSDLAPLVLAVVAAAGPIEAAAMASHLRLPVRRVFDILHALASDGRVRFIGSAGYDDPDSSTWRVTDAGLVMLDDHSRDVAWSQENSSIYFIVEEPSELGPLCRAVEDLVGRDHCAELPRGISSAPANELAIAIARGPDRREILEKAYDVWFEARKNADLVTRLPRLADVSW